MVKRFTRGQEDNDGRHRFAKQSGENAAGRQWLNREIMSKRASVSVGQQGGAHGSRVEKDVYEDRAKKRPASLV